MKAKPYCEFELYVGMRKPLLRFAVGSGVEKYGRYATGTPENSRLAPSK